MPRNPSLADLPAHYQRQIAAQMAQQDARKVAADPAKRPSKYGAVRTEYRSTQGFARTYDSKGEAAYAARIDREIAAGMVRWWTCQVPFWLPGGKSYRADFLVVTADGGVRVIDFKGADTAMSKLKRDQVREMYGVEVEIVRAG